MTTRPLVVVEVEAGGHRMIYFAAVATWLAARGVPVALASTADALASDDLALRRPPPFEPIEIGVEPSARGLVAAVADVQARHPDHDVLVTEGDKFLPAMALAPRGVDPHRLRVLVMRVPRGGHPKELVKAVAMRRAARRGVDVRVLEPATAARAEYRRGRWRSVPDPVDLHAGERPPELDALSELSGDRHWLGVLGHVGPRKNLDLVLDAAASPDLGVLVAGRVEDGEWSRCAPAVERFRAGGGVLVTADRLLPDAALDACVAAVDTVVLAHSSEGPSGILGRAVALGTPVVAAGARSLRDDVARLDAGTWVELDRDALAAAITGQIGVRHVPRALAGSDEFARALLT